MCTAPKAKKRKTEPVEEVDDEEEVEGEAEDDEVEGKDLEDDEEDAGEEDADEDVSFHQTPNQHSWNTMLTCYFSGRRHRKDWWSRRCCQSR